MEFGPMHLWEQMTPIAKGVVFALILLSIWSLYVSIERLLAYRKARKESLFFAKQATELLRQDRINDAIDRARKFRWSHMARVTQAGLIQFNLEQAQHSLTGHDVVEAARRAIERETLITYSDFKKGVGSLATIATTAPFIGLFGTVIGIINAFRGMAMTGSGGIAAVSAGIAEALVTTALGLFVAIPAAWMFNHFTNTLFMVVTPLLQKGVDVSLPETAKPERMPEGGKQLDVAIKFDGSVFVGQNWVPRENLLAALTDVYRQSPEKDVVIKADRRIKYRDVRAVMRTIQQAGFPGAGIETRRKDRGTSP